MGSGKDVALVTNRLETSMAAIIVAKVLALSAAILVSLVQAGIIAGSDQLDLCSVPGSFASI